MGGLAAPRKRQKLQHDPNNTAWSRSTDSYGRRILAAQGWSPGSFLGARDAAHAEHYSAASASHVRVALKEDNLGLGASLARENEPTGLGSFQDLLGRLNGKAESQIEEDRRQRVILGKKLYAHQRFGTTKFVRAGFLVGDQILDTPEAPEMPTPPQETTAQPDSTSQTNDEASETTKPKVSQHDGKSPEDRAARKRHREERRARKAERARTKEARREERKAAKRKAKHEARRVETKAPVAQDANVRQAFLRQKQKKAAMDPQALREILMVRA